MAMVRTVDRMRRSFASEYGIASVAVIARPPAAIVAGTVLPRRLHRNLPRLLDGRQDPPAARRTNEGPQFGGRDVFGGAAVSDAARGVARHVDHREAHRHRRVFAVALAPGLRQVALEQMYVGDLVAHALAGLGGQLFGEVAQHFGCCQRSQRIQVLPAPDSLDVLQQPLELLVVLRADLDRWRPGRTARPSDRSRAGSAAPGKAARADSEGGRWSAEPP